MATITDSLNLSGNQGYHSIDENVRDEGEYAEKTLLGKIRSIKNFKWMEWSFILIGVVILLSVGGLSIERFVYFSTHNYSNDSNVSSHSCDSNFDECLSSTCETWICMTDFTFVILVLVNVVICCFYAVDSLLREQKFEMLAVCIATIVISLYIIVNFITNGPEEEQGPVRILRLVLCFVLGMPFFVLALMLYY
jgi:magnesium-transporting ATPase (P-type)